MKHMHGKYFFREKQIGCSFGSENRFRIIDPWSKHGGGVSLILLIGLFWQLNSRQLLCWRRSTAERNYLGLLVRLLSPCLHLVSICKVWRSVQKATKTKYRIMKGKTFFTRDIVNLTCLSFSKITFKVSKAERWQFRNE